MFKFLNIFKKNKDILPKKLKFRIVEREVDIDIFSIITTIHLNSGEKFKTEKVLNNVIHTRYIDPENGEQPLPSGIIDSRYLNYLLHEEINISAANHIFINHFGDPYNPSIINNGEFTMFTDLKGNKISILNSKIKFISEAPSKLHSTVKRINKELEEIK